MNNTFGISFMCLKVFFLKEVKILEKIPFSLRLKLNIIRQFQDQAKKESLKQGELFEKIFNLYLGKHVEVDFIPFNVNLFWFNNLSPKSKNLDKKIYTGYGVPLYVSNAFIDYGVGYYNDLPNKSYESVYEDADKSIYKRTELMLCTARNLSWSKLDSEIKTQQFQRDFKIKNPQNYYYMSAFRVFKEMENDLPIIMVNEQIYLIDEKKYLELNAESISGAITNNSDNIEFLFAKDFDLAISTLHKIKKLSEGEKILKLDREYLNLFDRENLKNILKSKVSKDDAGFDNILSEYAIFN